MVNLQGHLGVDSTSGYCHLRSRTIQDGSAPENRDAATAKEEGGNSSKFKKVAIVGIFY